MAASWDLTLQLDDRAINGLTAPGGLADQATMRAAGRARDRAKMNLTRAGRIDTGLLRQSIVAERVRSSNNSVTYRVGSPLDYAIYQEEGVRGPIYPRRARVLRFRPKGGGAYIFRPYVSGFPGAHYLRDAFAATSAQDFAA